MADILRAVGCRPLRSFTGLEAGHRPVVAAAAGMAAIRSRFAMIACNIQPSNCVYSTVMTVLDRHNGSCFG